MGLFSSIGTSFRLTGASFRLIFRRPVVLVLPLLTLLWTGLLVWGPVSFFIWLAENHKDAFIGFWKGVYFVTVNALENGNIGLAISSAIVTSYVLWAVWMTLVFTGALYFMTVGMDVATQQIRQPTASLPAAFRLATRNLGRIFLLALFNATFIALVKYITTYTFSLIPFVGRWINRVFRFFLTAVTYLMLPIVVYERNGPISAFKSAWRNVRKTWSGVLVGSGLVFGAAWCLLNGFSWAILQGTLGVDPWVSLIFTIVWTGTLFALSTSVAAAMRATLYWYATTGEVPAGFQRTDLPTLSTIGPLSTVANVGLVTAPTTTTTQQGWTSVPAPATTRAAVRPTSTATGTGATTTRRMACPNCKSVMLVPAGKKPKCTACGHA